LHGRKQQRELDRRVSYYVLHSHFCTIKLHESKAFSSPLPFILTSPEFGAALTELTGRTIDASHARTAWLDGPLSSKRTSAAQVSCDNRKAPVASVPNCLWTVLRCLSGISEHRQHRHSTRFAADVVERWRTGSDRSNTFDADVAAARKAWASLIGVAPENVAIGASVCNLSVWYGQA
jgi:hypothetical protein